MFCHIARESTHDIRLCFVRHGTSRRYRHLCFDQFLKIHLRYFVPQSIAINVHLHQPRRGVLGVRSRAFVDDRRHVHSVEVFCRHFVVFLRRGDAATQPRERIAYSTELLDIVEIFKARAGQSPLCVNRRSGPQTNNVAFLGVALEPGPTLFSSASPDCSFGKLGLAYFVREDCLLEVAICVRYEGGLRWLTTSVCQHTTTTTEQRITYETSIDAICSTCSFWTHLMRYSTRTSSMAMKEPAAGPPLGPK